jgi:hypothetical protein
VTDTINEDSEQAQLSQRVRELEARLNSVPLAALEATSSEGISEPLHDGPPSSAPMQGQTGLPRGTVSTPTATPRADVECTTDDATVDALATAAFNDVPEGSERNIGFFGKQVRSIHTSLTKTSRPKFKPCLVPYSIGSFRT